MLKIHLVTICKYIGMFAGRIAARVEELDIPPLYLMQGRPPRLISSIVFRTYHIFVAFPLQEVVKKIQHLCSAPRTQHITVDGLAQQAPH